MGWVLEAESEVPLRISASRRFDCLASRVPRSRDASSMLTRQYIKRNNLERPNMPSAVAFDRRPISPTGHDQPDYDRAVDDFMRDLEFDNENVDANTAPQEPPKDIDEEVQVKKKRKPNPKLDEARLLSQNGVPKLRRLTKSKLKFRGKGHEYADITTLLNMYQLWLDDLYPKAKFKDGLTMVERVGHSKRMQITRRGWLDATKPHRRDDSPERVGDVEVNGGLGSRESGAEAAASRGADDVHDEIFGISAQQGDSRGVNGSGGHESAPEDDELDALMNQHANASRHSATAKQPPARGPFEEDSDPEDELDALLGEQEAAVSQKNAMLQMGSGNAASSHDQEVDDFADDEEAMASMGW